MSLAFLIISAQILAFLPLASASVAVGIGTLNPENSGECLDPDTGLGHPLGLAWSVGGCGQAECELLDDGVVLISYSFCGASSAQPPCYLSTLPSLPYPYCCPRSFCPPDSPLTDISTNEIPDSADPLQMEASDISQSQVKVAPPSDFVSYDTYEDDNIDAVYQMYDTVEDPEPVNQEENEIIDWDKIFKDIFLVYSKK